MAGTIIYNLAHSNAQQRAKVISGKPNIKFTHIQNVHKNRRENTKFFKIKPEKDMANQQNRGHRGVTKH